MQKCISIKMFFKCVIFNVNTKRIVRHQYLLYGWHEPGTSDTSQTIKCEARKWISAHSALSGNLQLFAKKSTQLIVWNKLVQKVPRQWMMETHHWVEGYRLSAMVGRRVNEQELASDWLRVILWPGYWPLIGRRVNEQEPKYWSELRWGQGPSGGLCGAALHHYREERT